MQDDDYSFLMKITENNEHIKEMCETGNIKEVVSFINKVVAPRGIDAKEALAFLGGYWGWNYDNYKELIK